MRKEQKELIIHFEKGRIEGRIQSYNYPGIGSGFRAEGDEQIELYSRRFRGKIPYAMGKEFKTLRAAKKYMERHGYKEVQKAGSK